MKPSAGIDMQHNTESPASIQLPRPSRSGVVSLEEALSQRRSAREFSPGPLTERQLSQLLWAAQGVTSPGGHRTAPSAGALYPLEIYAVMSSGFYHYDPPRHRLARLSPDDLRPALHRAALEQQAIREPEVVFVMTASYERTAQKYGTARSPRYVHLEAGHAAQNLLLEAVALGLGAVSIGAFHDTEVQKVLSLPWNHEPLYLIPAGKPR
jgi:SagB-type dehydrogenase family enzyme